MRIQHTNFILTLRVKHSIDTTNIIAYGSDFNILPFEHIANNKVDTINIQTYLPNRVMLVIPENSQIELVDMALAGIKINNNILKKIVEYKPNLLGTRPALISDHLNNSSKWSTIWDQSGCVLFDFFHPDPFAYHMYIGNRIRF